MSDTLVVYGAGVVLVVAVALAVTSVWCRPPPAPLYHDVQVTEVSPHELGNEYGEEEEEEEVKSESAV